MRARDKQNRNNEEEICVFFFCLIKSEILLITHQREKTKRKRVNEISIEVKCKNKRELFEYLNQRVRAAANRRQLRLAAAQKGNDKMQFIEEECK